MAKVLLFLIIGLILGLGVAAAARELGYWGVPSRSGVRPNLRKGRLKFAVVPVAGAVFVSVLAWLAFGALFTPDTPSQPGAGNSVSKPIPSSKPLAAPSGSTTPTTTRPSKAQPSPTERLVADSPMAEAALRVSPIQSALEQIGSLGARAAAPSSAATVKPKPEAKPQKPPAETSTKPPSPTAQPKPAEPPKPAQVETGVAYTVHLASFTEKGNADRTLAKLKAAGVPAFVSQVEINGQTWHRLMVGRFPTQEQAKAYGKQLQEKGLTADMGPYKVKPIASGG